MFMENQTSDILNEGDMPSTFEELEVRRTLCKKQLNNPDVNAEWEDFLRRIDSEESSADSALIDAEEEQKNVHRKMIYAFLSGVAAAIFALFILYPLFKPSSSFEVITANKNDKDIVISSDDGDMKVVNNQKILSFKQTVPAVSSLLNKVKMIELSTPRGKDCQITLPDGSKVWLNADSKISFPERFTGKNRNVKVDGEAYFEVSKDQKHPFIVTTDFFTTTVHGTVFNINAYSAKTANVTLISGSVAVKSGKGKEIMISPGQMAKYNNQGEVQVDNVDTYPITQWKDGFFYFDNERLVDIMMELGRWYNISVVFQHENDMNRRLHFVAEHKESLHEIIKRLNDLNLVTVKIENDHVSIE